MIYQSTNNNKIKELKKLMTKKFRDKTGMFLVEGYHLVEEAKKAGVLDCVISTNEYDFKNNFLVTKEVIKFLNLSNDENSKNVNDLKVITKEKEK